MDGRCHRGLKLKLCVALFLHNYGFALLRMLEAQFVQETLGYSRWYMRGYVAVFGMMLR